MTNPIVILATGQSNIQLHPSYPWSPPSNLYLWDWDGQTDPATAVGTAFYPMDASTMGVSYSFGAQIALSNPDRDVYVVNIGIGALPIARWLAGTPAPDMYAACKANIEAALASIGAGKIDELLWWQGENDALGSSSTYVPDFETVIIRFRGEAWFPYNTPVTIMGVSVNYISAPPAQLLKFFNSTLRQVASREPENRVYVNTSSLPLSLWDAPANIHMRGEGYRLAGELAYRSAKLGVGRQPTPWQTVIKRYSEPRAGTNVLADDAELGFSVLPGKAYRVRGSIVGQTPALADFMYGFVGPSGVVIQTYHRQMQESAPNSETYTMSAGTTLPVGQIIFLAGGAAFRLEVDMIIYSPSAPGRVRFQWCQAAPNATTTYVFTGSYLEYFEIPAA